MEPQKSIYARAQVAVYPLVCGVPRQRQYERIMKVPADENSAAKYERIGRVPAYENMAAKYERILKVLAHKKPRLPSTRII